LLGQGDGTLGAETVFRAGAAPKALAVGDFNRDGRPDLVAANDGANTVSVLLGVGDGSFRAPTPFAVGLAPVDVVVGQFSDDNGDGVINDRDFLDIVTANRDSNDVSLLLGNGDGTFQAAQQVALSTTGAGPVALAAGQFNDDNGDGLIDNRDFLDLATVSPAADSGAELTILLGNGKGTFTPVTGAAPVGVGDVPTDLVVGDFTNDGILDLAIGNASPDDPLADEDILIFAGDGQGHFGLDGVQFVGGIGPGVALAAGDFNGDGLTDLAVATGAQAFDIILLNSADAGLDFGSLFVPGESFALATADFNGDGLDDLVNATTFPNNVLVGLASVQVDPIGGEMFLEFIAGEASSDVRSTPILVDVNGDGLTDSVVVGEDGRVLLRLREANAQGTFAPPILVNPLTLPSPPSDGGEGRVRGRPARAVTAVQVGGETLLAATDQSLNPALGRTGNVITLYRISANGRPSVAGELAISDSSSPDEPARNGSQLSRIVAADLNGDGIEDLAVLDRLNGLPGVSVFLGDGAGGFQIFTDELGQSRDFLQFDLDETGPVDLAAVDVTGDGFVDLVVTDQLSGDVTVLVNGDEGRGPDSVDFGSQVLRFRAGAGPFSIPSGSGPFLLEDPPETVRSQDRPAGVAVADFNSDGIVDVVVADAGTNNFAFLAGRGRGSFANPVVTQLSFSPALVVAGQFNDDNGDKKIDARDNADLAFLNESGETVSIFLGDGHGGFTEKVARDASGNIVPLRSGNSPTGLSVADVNGDGRLDLQVGNAFGDVLTLLGNGDGTFQPARRANSDVLLATGDFNGDGVADALVANAARDQVSVQLRVAGTNTFTQGSLVGTADTGLQAPVAPVLADLNGDGRADTIVANSGGNTVTVFLAQADGSVVTRSFFAGTSPAGIAVRDLNGDSIPDLIVANQGSNDVSILFGQGQGDSYTLTSGPRIRAGNGPISADVVADFNGDNIADLMVVNGQDGTVSFVPGRGKGFFDDTAAQVRALKDPASGGTPVIDVSVDGFLVTDSGAILNAATGGTVFFDATRQARAIDTVTLAGGVGLVVAFGDGSLSLLTADANGNFSQSQVLADTGLVDPSAVQILGDGERLEAYVTEAGDSVPFVFAFDLTAAANGTGPGGEAVASGATGSADEASVVSVSQTQVSDSTLNFVATLLGSGPLDATLSAVQGPSGTEASVAPDVVLGIGDVLDNSASRSGSTEGSELPVEVWLPYLIERVAQLAPNLTESIASTEQGLSEAIAQATALAAGPLGLALEALQVKDIPLVEPGLVGLAGEIGTELVGVGRDLAARFALQSREQLKVETPAPQEPLPVNTTRPEARAEAPVPVQDTAVDQKAQDGEGSSLEEASFSGESSEPDAVAVEEMFQRDKLLVALLTTAVFASGFSHRRQRDTRKQAPRLENVRRPAKSTR
ncbi:MAG: VCBS repeat-containing protein, partial [Planctomycetes bacterium]|nr:VCBS repeat-containing protein [Planctomycetota bacterium]